MSRALSCRGIPLYAFKNSRYAAVSTKEDKVFHTSNSVKDFGNIVLEDSFQRKVTEKTNAFFVGKQEAENEVYIDHIISQQGDRDKALIYVVEQLENEERAHVLVNCLINRGANPSFCNASFQSPLHFAVKKNFKGICKKLLENGAWPNTRDSSSQLPLTIALENKNDELASLIILYMRNIDVRKLFSCNGSLQAEFSFHKLLAEKQMEKTVLAVLNCMIDLIGNDGKAEVHFHVLESDENGRSPGHCDFNHMSRSPFQIIAKSGNKTITNHDVIRLLIRRKWKRFARFRFLINTIIYMLTLACLSYAAVTAAMTDDPLVYQGTKHIIRAVCEVLLVLSAIVTLVLEIHQMKKHRLDYFTEKFNYLELSSCLFFLALIPLRVLGHPNQWQIFSVVFLIWTLRIFKYAAVFRQTGAYAQILVRIIGNDFVQFMVVFAVILLVFSGTLLLALKGGNPDVKISDTSTFWDILFLGLRILTEGEKVIEYTSLDGWSCFVMVMFLFSCIVLLLNILIAQLSDTYQNIQQDAQRGLEANRAWIVARIELRSMRVGKGVRFRFYKWSKQIKDINKVLEKWESPPLQDMNKCVQTIEDTVQNHKLNLLAVTDRLSRQERALVKIQEQLDKLLRTNDQDCAPNGSSSSQKPHVTVVDDNRNNLSNDKTHAPLCRFKGDDISQS